MDTVLAMLVGVFSKLSGKSGTIKKLPALYFKSYREKNNLQLGAKVLPWSGLPALDFIL